VNGDALYQDALLRLAREATGAGRLEAPDGTAACDNPLCGDDVVMDVRLRGGAVAALGHRVRGCVLCQAAASALGAAAPGRTPDELRRARGEVAAMLAGAAPPPGGPWEALGAFLPVRAVRSRHACVLLPFDAAAAALAAAGR
jgi:nitrogen fixation NifU-like protein